MCGLDRNFFLPQSHRLNLLFLMILTTCVGYIWGLWQFFLQNTYLNALNLDLFAITLFLTNGWTQKPLGHDIQEIKVSLTLTLKWHWPSWILLILTSTYYWWIYFILWKKNIYDKIDMSPSMIISVIYKTFKNFNLDLEVTLTFTNFTNIG